jgi:hypothetical protein
VGSAAGEDSQADSASATITKKMNCFFILPFLHSYARVLYLNLTPLLSSVANTRNGSAILAQGYRKGMTALPIVRVPEMPI